MKKIRLTEKDLINLGFKRFDEKDDNYYYYTYDIGKLCLLSQANDEVVGDEWHVEIFEHFHFRITDLEDLKTLIKILEKTKVD